MTKKYDVVVVGSGIAGLGTAAILARDFQQKVLVLERNPFIGGRLASFVGKGDKVYIDGRGTRCQWLQTRSGTDRSLDTQMHTGSGDMFQRRAV